MASREAQVSKIIHSLRMKNKHYKKANVALSRQVSAVKSRQLFLQEAMLERNARLQDYAKVVEMKASEVLKTMNVSGSNPLAQ